MTAPVRKFVYIDSTEGYSAEQEADAQLSLGKVTALGVGGVAFDGNSQLFSGMATPVSDTDGANKAYVDSVASGLDVKASVRLATAAALPTVIASGTGVGKTLTATVVGTLTVDGVLTVLGDRILVKNQATQADNGIYTVTTAGDITTAFVLTRAVDADTDAEVTAGMFTFSTEGTANDNIGWVLTANDPITVDTSAQAFSQFSTAVSLTFGAGLSLSTGNVDVELDTGAAAQTGGSGGGSSGLEFDTSGAAGKLRAAVNATGGLQRSGSGLSALLNGTTLQTGASGLSVKGLPALFEIATVAVGSTVTAANLDTLTDGSNADALHIHSMSNVEALVAKDDVAIGDPVAWSSTSAKFSRSDASISASARCFGIATGTILADATGNIQRAGILAGALSGATPGAPYFLAEGGGLTTTPPSTSGARVVRAGWAVTATDFEISFQDLGQKA